MNQNYSELTYEEDFIRELQNMLRAVGRDFSIDALIIPETGTYDNVTADAVRAFQRLASLDPTGEVDNITWDALVREYKLALRRNSETGAIKPYPRYDGYELTVGERSELVFITQLMLNSLGLFYDLPRVPISGVYDELTTEAVRQFQMVNLLPVTGKVDRFTWDRLAEEYNETVNENQ